MVWVILAGLATVVVLYSVGNLHCELELIHLDTPSSAFALNLHLPCRQKLDNLVAGSVILCDACLLPSVYQWHALRPADDIVQGLPADASLTQQSCFQSAFCAAA